MVRQASELESILQQLIAEHRRLLVHLDAHGAAMKAFDLEAMDDAGRQQDLLRVRIATLDQRRRAATVAAAKALNLPGEPTLRTLAAALPQHAQSLMQIRADLKAVVEQVAARARISGKLASAVLGHLNTIVRLLAGAVERAGVYTKQGIPMVSSRIGMMEAVG